MNENADPVRPALTVLWALFAVGTIGFAALDRATGLGGVDPFAIAGVAVLLTAVTAAAYARP